MGDLTPAVKVLREESDGSFVVGGYGVVWGGKDVTGDYFTPETDFWFDRLTETPMVLYQHGQDQELKRVVVGRVTSKRPDDIGLWVEAQIRTAQKYAEAIRQLVGEGVIGWSSGAVKHLVDRRADGFLASWPVAELSLTPTPAEPRTVGVAEIKALLDEEPSLKSVLGDDTDPSASQAAKALSFEEIRTRISALLNPPRPVPSSGGLTPYTYVVETYPDHVIARTEESDGDMETWRVPYSIGEDGETVILGQAVRVEPVYVPVTGDSTKGTPAVKAGRPMSGRNLDQMHGAMKQMQALHATVCDLGSGCPMGAGSEGEKKTAVVNVGPTDEGIDEESERIRWDWLDVNPRPRLVEV